MEFRARKARLGVLVSLVIAWGYACAYPDYGGFEDLPANEGGAAGDASLDTEGGAAGEAGFAGTKGGSAGAGGLGTGGLGGAAGSGGGSTACTGDGDCASSPLGAFCDSSTSACVQCLPSKDNCPLGMYCAPTKICKPGCNDNLDCTGSVDGGTTLYFLPAPKGGSGGEDAGEAGSAGDPGEGGASGESGSAGATGSGGASGEAGSAGSGDGGSSGEAGGAGEAGASGFGGDGGEGGVADASIDADEDSGAGQDADDEAQAEAGGPLVCDLNQNQCTGCTSSAQCPAGTLCDTQNAVCVPGCDAEHACPGALQCCTTECADVSNDPSHCGACGTPCAPPNALAACQLGKCVLLGCEEGFKDCDGDAANGCETSIATDPVNCGACAKACEALPNASPGCSGGQCTMGPCTPGFANCNMQLPDGCETSLLTEVANCGQCQFACDLANANEICQSGVCAIGSCAGGFANCDKIVANGCEANLQADSSHCGVCGNKCQFQNAAAACVAGVCKLDDCVPPLADCNNDGSDGCEVNKNTDVANCGGCGNFCALPNASPGCNNGVCQVGACATGFGNCDGQDPNGCEINFDTDASHCGGCGKGCSTNNGTPSCQAGACVIACLPGFADCDGNAANGCEINTQINVEHCNSCGNACSATGGTPNCVAGKCGISTCLSPLADCNGQSSDGCEINTANDVLNCGGCGKECFVANGTPGCTGGVCTVQSCTAGYANCNTFYQDGCEASLKTSLNCGACAAECVLPNANTTCVTGTCEITSCMSPFGDCDGVKANGCEVNLTVSVPNCGNCGAACNSTNGSPMCEGSTCKIDCASGFGNCNASAVDGCETNLKNNVTNCGVCGLECTVANGTPTCSGTTCGVLSCTAPYADCDLLYANGCEIKSDIDPNHCGACGKVCSSNNGIPSCVLGACAIACLPGFANCDGNVDNGCETNTQNNVEHCNGCGIVCSASGGTANCVGGKCGISACLPPLADCNGVSSDGCEINTAGNVLHCGGCGKECFVANGTAGCTGGVCNVQGCSAGYENCNTFYQDGCEASLKSLLNCGGCGVECVLPNANATCSTGTCEITSCKTPYGDCDGTKANGCEVDLTSTVAHCGSCGAACNATNGSPQCQGGACSIVCASGFGNCNASASDGCETNLKNNVTNCGACDNECTVANGTPTCNGTSCAVLSCTAPYANCDFQYVNGCEVNTSSNPLHCGGCGQACNSTHGTPGCQAGVCSIACTPGYGNCNGSAVDGCEVNLSTDATNCGTCGKLCSFPNGTSACVAGTCTLTGCLAGWGNCDNNATNGCETNLKTSPTNCNGCGQACSVPHAVPSCVNGACAVGTCTAPWADCDGNAANGCETNTSSTPTACGGCGVLCNSQNGTPTCTNSVCGISCNIGFANCDGVSTNGCEINTQTDVLNCNACGNVCSTTGGTPNCVAGVCGVSTCAAGLGNCDGNAANGCETDLTKSVTNCGQCGTVCTVANGSGVCVNSACMVGACDAGFANCDGQYANGCETNLKTTANCGSCGQVCNLANAIVSCATGTCAISSCVAPYANCDGNAVNGCETNTSSNVGNCGTCGTVCSTNHGSATCTGGNCSIACASGWGNCNANVTDGCETAITNNVNACGSCNTVCTVPNGTPACISTTCAVQACTAPYKDCNNLYSDGCETNANTSVANCGACGTVCNGTNGTAACSTGACTISCNPGFGNCDNAVSNGCESNLNSDVLHCGNCTTVCSFANASAVCNSGACALGSCNAGYANCDGLMPNGCEIALNTNANCGECGKACTNANGTTSCVAGVCTPSCLSGFGNCDGNPNNGCETSLKTLTDCGGCGTLCDLPNASESCATGVCSLTTCNTGWGNCDNNPSNGCETNTNSTVGHCGACNAACSSANGTPACSGGACTITCNAGWGNCDSNVGNGCETNTGTSTTHCGTCGNACSFTNASATCFAGTCQLGTCTAGWGNCDSNATNGCETSLKTLSNCGGCGVVCNYQNAAESCTTGTCILGTCTTGFANCDGVATNGCETSIRTLSNCGLCGVICDLANASETCTTGACALVSCNVGWGNCDNVATNGCEASLATTTHCGACGVACTNANGSTACVSSVCTPTCNPGYASCDNNPNNGCEVNLQTSTSHCGGCGNVCTNPNGTVSCTAGVCTPGCAAGYGNCDGNPNNGCETNLQTTLTSCGTCGTACVNPNGTTVCAAGACVPTCSAGWGNCDGNPINGCETNRNTSTSNCGTCGTVCSCPSGTPSCTNGVCGCATCQTGFGDCDGVASNGCESALNTLTNCSACGTSCSRANATASCATYSCALVSCNAGWGNCDGNQVNGCETNTQTSTGNCGTCGTVCNSTNGTASCTLGACAIGCNAGYGNCDGLLTNGCEAALNTTTNCGTCGNTCTNAHGTIACSSGVCAPTCTSGWGNCDGNTSNGCETSLTSLTSCGACNVACSRPNASVSCSSGTCTLVSCNTGYGNCDGLASNGCEAALNTTSNCGACSNACTNANGTTSCVSGTCAPVCAAGFGNCDGNPSNGCETNTQTSTTSCGTCGTVCGSANGTASCALGVCSISCNTGWGNCNGLVTDGCETALNSTLNCGACGVACTNANGTTACTSGACVPACTSGWGNCDGNASNGCETSLKTNANCGSCGAQCAPANATGTCTTGTCGVASCNAGYGNCDGLVSNGCEAPLNLPSSCGSCTKVCTNPNGTTACVSGTCTPTCSTGYLSCDGNPNNGCETNGTSDALNCGACGTTCTYANATGVCVNSKCAFGACLPGFANCDGLTSNGCEVNTLTAVNNCGGCGTVCTNANGTTSCVNGVCAPICSTGYANCDGNLVNGCETNTSTNLSNCGGCGSVCTLPNASPKCTAGVCGINACNTGWGNCDGVTSNGCEVNTQTNVANCGGCGTVCSNNHGTPSCALSTCSIVCQSGWGNCDGNAQVNGCEIDLMTNPLNCGQCGKVCSGGCVAGSCACPTGLGDCDGNAANGCETSTATNPLHCGGCNIKCGSNGTCGCASGVCKGGVIYFSDDFVNNSKGWLLGPEWAIGPTMTSYGHVYGYADPAQDHSASADNAVAGVVLGGNAGIDMHDYYYLTSPVVNLSVASGTTILSFWRFLNSDYTPYMDNRVEVFNGSTWVVLWASGEYPGIQDPEWTYVSYDVTAYKNASFRVRFGFNIASGGVYTVSQWNVDDVTISSQQCL